MLQHTATRWNALQQIATFCNTTFHVEGDSFKCRLLGILQHAATHCNTLQHAATRCNTLQHTATRCNTLQRITAICNLLQHDMGWLRLVGSLKI